MALNLINLVKRYVGPDGSTVPVIDVPRFSLADGEQVALIGSSGSGKTTLLHLIAGILTPDSGRILFGSSAQLSQTSGGAPAGGAGVAGRPAPYHRPTPSGGGADAGAAASTGVIDLTALSEAQRDVFRGAYVGYIFQTHHLLPGFTAMENVLLGMSFTGRPHDPAWACHLLAEVGLADRLNYKPSRLSVGQQQRVAVARALANRPAVVLADEPTGALDPANANQVLELVRGLCAEVGASLLLVTHDMDIAAKLQRTVSLAELNRASTAARATAAVA